MPCLFREVQSYVNCVVLATSDMKDLKEHGLKTVKDGLHLGMGNDHDLGFSWPNEY